MIIDAQDLDRPDRPATGFLYALMKSIIQEPKSADVPSPSPLLRGARWSLKAIGEYRAKSTWNRLKIVVVWLWANPSESRSISFFSTVRTCALLPSCEGGNNIFKLWSSWEQHCVVHPVVYTEQRQRRKINGFIWTRRLLEPRCLPPGPKVVSCLGVWWAECNKLGVSEGGTKWLNYMVKLIHDPDRVIGMVPSPAASLWTPLSPYKFVLFLNCWTHVHFIIFNLFQSSNSKVCLKRKQSSDLLEWDQ